MILQQEDGGAEKLHDDGEAEQCSDADEDNQVDVAELKTDRVVRGVGKRSEACGDADWPGSVSGLILRGQHRDGNGEGERHNPDKGVYDNGNGEGGREVDRYPPPPERKHAGLMHGDHEKAEGHDQTPGNVLHKEVGEEEGLHGNVNVSVWLMASQK